MLLSQLQPYLDELTHHISDLMAEVDSQNEITHGHLRSFRICVDMIPMNLQNPEQPSARTRQYLNELWHELEALDGVPHTRKTAWHMKILRDTLTCLSQSIDEQIGHAFEFPTVATSSQSSSFFFSQSTPDTTTCETAVHMTNTLKDTLMQQAERMEHDFIYLDISTQTWNDLQIRSLTLLGDGIQHLLNAIDELPSSYAPMNAVTRHDLRNHLTVIQGFAQILGQKRAGEMTPDDAFIVQSILTSSRSINAAIEAEKEIYGMTA